MDSTWLSLFNGCKLRFRQFRLFRIGPCVLPIQPPVAAWSGSNFQVCTDCTLLTMGSGGSAQAHQPQEPQEPGQTPEVAPRIQSAGARTDANKVDPADGASPGKTPHDLAKDSDDKKVFVALLSGKDCECLWLQDRTIGQLKEEAQQKLDIAIKNLIGPSMEPLDEEKMLAEENILPGTTLTVVVVDQAAEDEKEAEECPDIFEAAYRGNVAAVRHFLRTEPSAAAAKHEILGDTPLHVAAWHGQAAICQVLLAADAEVDARDGGEDLFEGFSAGIHFSRSF
eukprot:s2125_g13.t1